MRNEIHDQRYWQLQSVREKWCHGPRDVRDRSGITIELNGREIADIPSFFLSLGQAVNGPGGYYGGDLDALSDCLCGGFGLVPPFTLRFRYADAARDALGRDAMLCWHESRFGSVDSASCDSSQNNKKHTDWEALFATLDSPVNSYFDSIVSVLIEGGVNVVLDLAGE